MLLNEGGGGDEEALPRFCCSLGDGKKSKGYERSSAPVVALDENKYVEHLRPSAFSRSHIDF